MREIEFRAWLKNENRMITNISSIKVDIKCIYYDNHQMLSYDRALFDEIELMQYTGLKDKNGKKIFEGDIVRCDDEICSIVWDEPYVTYAVSDKENGNDSLGNFESKDLEIIGNIYENKELLEGEEK